MSSPPVKRRKIGDPDRPQQPRSSNQIQEQAFERSYQIQRFLFNDPDNDSTTWAIIEGRRQEPKFIDSQTTASPPGSCEDDSSAAGADDSLTTSVSFHQKRSKARLAESSARFEGPHAEVRATRNNLSYPDSEPCKEGKQFPNISKLREHLKRVHSPEYRCSDCNHKFSQVSVAELQDLRASHRPKCSHAGRTPLPGFDMTAEQWEKCKNWSQNRGVDRGSRNGLSERKPAWSWRRIYNSLFPADRIAVGQDPCAFKPIGPRAHQLPRAQPRGPTKGAGPAPTMTPSEFVSVFSLDFKASNGSEDPAFGDPWPSSNPQGPSSITPSSTSGTTETVESAPSQSEIPARQPVTILDDYMDSAWADYNPNMDANMDAFLGEYIPGMQPSFGQIDERMDGSGT
ncbi:unnamed protein product [Clonostachys byssicola]|uniref:C2H2-type domain-containing protein n=1 Tax=Clonostachys byssicola TaxID=160290 RepID=A0A9N9UV76_9HYPO|nr:unnamed protein product [Clonostachys byssicola]